MALVKNIGHNENGVLNVQILNQLIESFSLLDGKGKAALEAFQSFNVCQIKIHITLQSMLFLRDQTDQFVMLGLTLRRKSLI